MFRARFLWRSASLRGSRSRRWPQQQPAETPAAPTPAADPASPAADAARTRDAGIEAVVVTGTKREAYVQEIGGSIGLRVGRNWRGPGS